jgi:hypothetical protein
MVKPHPLSLCGEWGSLGDSLSCPPTFGNPATSLLERSMGFAPPPRGGFAFVALPERHSACELSSYLGALQSIGHMAICPEPGGPA